MCALHEDDQTNKIRPVQSQKQSNIITQNTIEINDNDSSPHSVISTPSSAVSCIANYLSRSFIRLSSSRVKYRKRDDSLDIPLMEMAGDRGDAEINDSGAGNSRTIFGPNLV